MKQYLLKKTMKNLFVGSLQQKLRSCCQEYCWLVAAMMISCFFFNNAFLANRLNYFKKYETFHLPLQNKEKRETRNPNILILFVFIFFGRGKRWYRRKRFIKISTNDRHADLRLTDPQNTYHLPKTLRSKQVKKPQSSPP